MQKLYRFVALLAFAGILTTFCVGMAAAEKKAYTFRGKIEAVDQKAGTLTVNGEEVKGWMEAMTMDYGVDDVSVLKTVKPGDQIMATVYEGDMVLHKVHVMPKQANSKTKM
jgi:protein SCO1/2